METPEILDRAFHLLKLTTRIANNNCYVTLENDDNTFDVTLECDMANFFALSKYVREDGTVLAELALLANNQCRVSVARQPDPDIAHLELMLLGVAPLPDVTVTMEDGVSRGK